MAADRHEDRSDQAHTTEQTLTQPKHHQLREQVQGSVRQIRARAQRGERQGPGVIDNHMDRIVSENANSTRDAPGRTSDGDGLTNDRLRATLESHRRELDLSAVSHQAARTESQGTRDLAPRQSREAKPPRKEYERDPKDPRPPERPSITTLSQKRSYGPQSFSRDDMIDKAKHARQQPSITTGGGRGLPMPAHAPTPAGGYAAAQDRARAAQAHAR